MTKGFLRFMDNAATAANFAAAPIAGYVGGQLAKGACYGIASFSTMPDQAQFLYNVGNGAEYLLPVAGVFIGLGMGYNHLKERVETARTERAARRDRRGGRSP